MERPSVLPGHFIDLEGIDQSGKKTQTRLLVAKLRRKGLKAVTLDFPVYSTSIGQEIQAFLNGKRNYPPQAVHMLYSLNRWENRDRIIRALDSADFLLADRYSASNLAYGLAKGLDLGWLISLDRGLPMPERVIVLDIPVGSSFVRKSHLRDLHESDRALLLKVRRNYLRLANRFHWQVVDGTRSATVVHSEIWKSVPSQKPTKNTSGG